MNLRSFIVRMILVLLAITAATAVIGIFIPGTTFVWRLVGTGAIGIVLGGIGLRFVAMVDRPSTQLAGLVGLASCALIGLVAGAVTMGLTDLVVPRAGESWFLTLVLLVGVASLTVVGVLLHGAAKSTSASLALLLVTVLLLALGLFGIWGPPSLGDMLDRVVALFWTIAWFGTLGALSLVGVGGSARPSRSIAVAIRVVGVVSAFVGTAIVGRALMAHDVGDPPTGALVASTFVLPIALWTLLELCRVPARLAWLPVATVVAAAVAMGSTTVGVWLDDHEQLWWRLALASTIVSACGVVATCVVSRVARSIAAPTKVTDLSDVIDLHCPLCKLRQTVPIRVGNATASEADTPPTCTRCGLELVVVATVPKCATCEHILLWATTASCPECGAARPSDRSASAS